MYRDCGRHISDGKLYDGSLQEEQIADPGLVRNDNPGFLWYDGKNVHENARRSGQKEQQEVESLYEKLVAYGAGDACPFHMPGHKRNMGKWGFADPFSFDITEIDGFDNLHHAEGILKEAQERAARVYGARRTFFLINGSSAGILAAVSACVPRGGKLLMARNCHKAVYHAASLLDLETVYVYPEQELRYGLNGGISPAWVERLLEEHPDVRAVIVTSPTYDGVVSDIRAIAQIVHERGLFLIVDEAHGAHLAFSAFFPDSALNLGADVVIQSVHKTLPSLTQTAILHVSGQVQEKRAQLLEDRLGRYLDVYQTSSPSYVLMASIDRCMAWLSTEGPRAFAAYVDNLTEFREAMGKLSHLRLVGPEVVGTAGICDLDLSKLVFSGKEAEIGGEALSQKFRRQFGIELEMAAGSYALALSSVMDSRENFARLARAAEAIDAQVGEAKVYQKGPGEKRAASDGLLRLPQVMRLSAAEDAPWEALPVMETAGRICGEWIYLYPPGIPLAAPGERIIPELLVQLERYRRQGMSLEGMRDLTGEKLRVVCETPGK